MEGGKLTNPITRHKRRFLKVLNDLHFRFGGRGPNGRALPPGRLLGGHHWHSLVEKGGSSATERKCTHIHSPESPLFLAHGPQSHAQREPTVVPHVAGAVPHAPSCQHLPRQPSQRLAGSGHSELTWSWPRESRPETQLSRRPVAAAGLKSSTSRLVDSGDKGLPCTVQARCEEVSREREVGRRDGMPCWQPHQSGTLGGGKAWHSICKASRQPRCRCRLSEELWKVAQCH